MGINADKFNHEVELLPIAAITEDADGTGVDVSEYVGTGKIILISAAGTGTTPTLDVSVEDSADDSTYAAITGAAFAEVDDTAGGSLQAIHVDLDACRQYLRLTSAVTGTTPSFTCGAVLVTKKQRT